MAAALVRLRLDDNGAGAGQPRRAAGMIPAVRRGAEQPGLPSPAKVGALQLQLCRHTLRPRPQPGPDFTQDSGHRVEERS